jgi:hypothetical protein
MPWSPEARVSMSSSSSMPYPCRRSPSTTPGSRSPERVAIGSPPSGENPIEVSMERPCSTAQAEQPAPSCSVTAVTPPTGTPSSAANDSANEA